MTLTCVKLTHKTSQYTSQVEFGHGVCFRTGIETLTKIPGKVETDGSLRLGGQEVQPNQ